MKRKGRLRKRFVGLLIVLMLLSCITPCTGAFAKSAIRLSRTKRTFDMIGLWDKLTLKNAPSGARIRWKSSDTKVVKIKEKTSSGIWYKVTGNGKASITAKCKGKKYVCRITVKEEKTTPVPTKTPTATPDPDDEQEELPDTGISLNATEVTLYYCTDSLTSIVHDPGHLREFQFKLLGTTKKPTWTLTYDDLPGLILSKDGLLEFSDLWISPKREATVTARLSNTQKYTAHVTLINEEQIYYDKKIADFKERYISEDMTDLEKAKAVCKYVSVEYDYNGRQSSWFYMVIGGGGDCMASRVGVQLLCKEIGLKAFACTDLSDHGRCVIRVGDDVYMSITGYDGVKPRSFSFYKMSEESIQKVYDRYVNCKKILGF